MAVPNFTAMANASSLKTGSTPGKPKSTSEACVLAPAPKAVLEPEKIFDFVAS